MAVDSGRRGICPGGEREVLCPAATPRGSRIEDSGPGGGRYHKGRQRGLRGRRGRFNEARNVAIYLTRELRRATLDDICGPFRMGRYSSASSAIGRVKVQMAEDRKLEKRVPKIIGELCKRQA